MFVCIKTLHRKFSCEFKLLQMLQHGRLDRNFILSNNESLGIANRLMSFCKPLVILDLVGS